MMHPTAFHKISIQQPGRNINGFSLSLGWTPVQSEKFPASYENREEANELSIYGVDVMMDSFRH